MIILDYDTLRLKCRPLTRKDFSVFAEKVVADKEIQHFFDFGKSTMDVLDFLETLHRTECIPIGIFSKSTNMLIGYINGNVFVSGELLVEFFIFSSYCRNNYMLEALNNYINFCKLKGFNAFRFDVEPDNVASLSLLEKLGASHSDSQDFTANIPRKGSTFFQVYHIYR